MQLPRSSSPAATKRGERGELRRAHVTPGPPYWSGKGHAFLMGAFRASEADLRCLLPEHYLQARLPILAFHILFADCEGEASPIVSVPGEPLHPALCGEVISSSNS